jgi:hypothetical protein
VLLVLGAILSSYLIPSFTRQWQNRQNELALKTGLVGEITQQSSTALEGVDSSPVAAAILSAPSPANRKALAPRFHSPLLNRLEAIQAAWRTHELVTGAKLESYFPSGTLASDWKAFGNQVDSFLDTTKAATLMRGGSGQLSCVHLALLETSPGARQDDVSFRRARLKRPQHLSCQNIFPSKPIRRYTYSSPDETANQSFLDEWNAVYSELYHHMQELVDDILHSHVTSF